MAANLGNICVDSRPPGAEIQIDGTTQIGSTSIANLRTPATMLDLNPGPHTVKVSLGTDPPVSKTVNVTAGSTATLTLTIMTPDNKTKTRSIAVYTFIFMIFLIGMAIATRFKFYLVWPDTLSQNIFYFACAGGIGSLAFNMYEYIYHLGEGDFNVDFYLWYLFRPFIGIVYGTFIFFLVAGGLMTLSGTNAPSIDHLLDQKTVMFYIALSFLAGYAEEPVSLQLKAITEAIFKKPGEEGQGGHMIK